MATQTPTAPRSRAAVAPGRRRAAWVLAGPQFAYAAWFAVAAGTSAGSSVTGWVLD